MKVLGLVKHTLKSILFLWDLSLVWIQMYLKGLKNQRIPMLLLAKCLHRQWHLGKQVPYLKILFL